jgi:phosphatidylinositol glycan class M
MPSQYFIWYLILLPFYLPSSSLMLKPALGISAAVLWIIGQVTLSAVIAWRF